MIKLDGDPPEPAQLNEDETDRQAAELARVAGRKRCRKISYLLQSLLNSKNFEAPKFSDGVGDSLLFRFSVQVKPHHFLLLKKEKERDLRSLVATLHDIPQLGDYSSQEDLFDKVSSVIKKEIVGWTQGRNRSAIDDLVSELFRGIVEDVDRYRVYFVLRGVKVEGPPIEIGPVRFFRFDESVINQICALPKDADECTRSHVEITRDHMLAELKGRVGLTFVTAGDNDQLFINAQLLADRCVSALMFACCLLFPDMARSDHSSIGIEDCIGGRPAFIYTATEKDGCLSTVAERPRRGVLSLDLNDEVVQLLRRNHFDYLFGALSLAQPTELDEAIVRAVEWVGDAFADLSEASAFTKYWVALETLVSSRETGLTEYLKRSIPVLLTHGGYEITQKVEVSETMRRVATLYGRRGKAVHRGRRALSDQDLSDVRDFAAHVILTFIDLRQMNYVSPSQILVETDRLYLSSLKFLAIAKSKKYHRSSCVWAKRNAHSPLRSFKNEKEAQEARFTPCKTCITSREVECGSSEALEFS